MEAMPQNVSGIFGTSHKKNLAEYAPNAYRYMLVQKLKQNGKKRLSSNWILIFNN